MRAISIICGIFCGTRLISCIPRRSGWCPLWAGACTARPMRSTISPNWRIWSLIHSWWTGKSTRWDTPFLRMIMSMSRILRFAGQLLRLFPGRSGSTKTWRRRPITSICRRKKPCRLCGDLIRCMIISSLTRGSAGNFMTARSIWSRRNWPPICADMLSCSRRCTGWTGWPLRTWNCPWIRSMLRQ